MVKLPGLFAWRVSCYTPYLNFPDYRPVSTSSLHGVRAIILAPTQFLEHSVWPLCIAKMANLLQPINCKPELEVYLIVI